MKSDKLAQDIIKQAETLSYLQLASVIQALNVTLRRKADKEQEIKPQEPPRP